MGTWNSLSSYSCSRTFPKSHSRIIYYNYGIYCLERRRQRLQSVRMSVRSGIVEHYCVKILLRPSKLLSRSMDEAQRSIIKTTKNIVRSNSKTIHRSEKARVDVRVKNYK